MQENISEVLNTVFENIHPQVKISFKKTELGEYR